MHHESKAMEPGKVPIGPNVLVLEDERTQIRQERAPFTPNYFL